MFEMGHKAFKNIRKPHEIILACFLLLKYGIANETEKIESIFMKRF